MKEMEPRKEESQLIDERTAFFRCGVDYGADAKVLLVKDMNRLVWAKGMSTLIGVRGCGHSVSPCRLELRVFEREGERIRYKTSETLLSGGRLTKERLKSVKAQIDRYFGAGAADLADPKATWIEGKDEVRGWLMSEAKREEAFRAEQAGEWRRKMEEAAGGSSKGFKF